MALYYRADLRNYADASYPGVVKILSVRELAEYYSNNRSKYQFNVGYYSETSMADEVFSDNSGYDDEFFKKNFLLFIILGEGSGSIRHKVGSVSPENGLLKIDIIRTMPEIGTMDMAQWHIVLALDRSLSGLEAAVKIIDGR